MNNLKQIPRAKFLLFFFFVKKNDERKRRRGGPLSPLPKTQNIFRTCFSKVCWAARASGASAIIDPRFVENASSHPSIKPPVEGPAAAVFGDCPRTQTSLVCFASLTSWKILHHGVVFVS